MSDIEFDPYSGVTHVKSNRVFKFSLYYDFLSIYDRNHLSIFHDLPVRHNSLTYLLLLGKYF